ncbi:MAG TPA: hypothetical protein VFA06_13100 [Actinocrinis sp.]|uniref:hypothetical protein n=1 Tax=Actinocrinis sp. TaxID=1920516 RepID=UPI002D3475D1|nr:hypothetical protein [Actinocrinis sp.]HZU56802.1 hypothetical protein [Actinocrinis sp.]
MGVYLVSASTWYFDEESCWPKVFEALVTELEKRGVRTPLHIPEPQQLPRGSGNEFEEKLIPSMDGFSALCADELEAGESEVFEWDLLIPIDFEGAIDLPLPSSYSSTTTVRSAQPMLPVARRLAAVIDLPDDVPAYCDNLQLTTYFMDREEPEPGNLNRAARWRDDLGTAFYVAMYLRAAENSMRLDCPMFYT